MFLLLFYIIDISDIERFFSESVGQSKNRIELKKSK